MIPASSSSSLRRAITNPWSRVPLFWRFQIGGWLGHFLYAYPLKWVTMEDWSDTFWVALYRDGLGFTFTLLMRGIYQRIYHPGGGILRPALASAAMSLLGASAVTGLVLVFHHFLDFDRREVFTTPMVFAIFYFQAGLFAVWSALYFGIKSARDTAERNVLLARTEASRQQAELQMLRAQMSPHFLFNALSSIRAGLLPTQQPLKQAVQALADYLRYSLEQRTNDRVPIEKEYDAMTAYLAVEKARFREEIEVETEIAAAARPILVPGILLQPLVENAIKYGRQTSPNPLRVRLIVSRVDSVLRLEVANTGRWLEPSARSGLGGIGLGNLRQRLDMLYASKHRLAVAENDGWVVVSLELPLPE